MNKIRLGSISPPQSQRPARGIMSYNFDQKYFKTYHIRNLKE